MMQVEKGQGKVKRREKSDIAGDLLNSWFRFWFLKPRVDGSWKEKPEETKEKKEGKVKGKGEGGREKQKWPGDFWGKGTAPPPPRGCAW